MVGLQGFAFHCSADGSPAGRTPPRAASTGSCLSVSQSSCGKPSGRSHLTPLFFSYFCFKLLLLFNSLICSIRYLLVTTYYWVKKANLDSHIKVVYLIAEYVGVLVKQKSGNILPSEKGKMFQKCKKQAMLLWLVWTQLKPCLYNSCWEQLVPCDHSFSNQSFSNFLEFKLF